MSYEEHKIISRLMDEWMSAHPGDGIIPFDEVNRIYAVAREEMHARSLPIDTSHESNEE